jgi:CBS-domain-containing membrane protein
MWKRDHLIAPLLEAWLIFLAAALAWLTHRPLLFASLGPTAFELIETPRRASARPWNVLGGHAVAVAAGFACVALTGAWGPGMGGRRVLAVTLAAALTVWATLLLRVRQPAALSTALLVATGTMDRPVDAVYILLSVAGLVVVGEPLRRWRARTELDQPAPSGHELDAPSRPQTSEGGGAYIRR